MILRSHEQKKPLPREEIQGRGNTGVKDIFYSYNKIKRFLQKRVYTLQNSVKFKNKNI